MGTASNVDITKLRKSMSDALIPGLWLAFDTRGVVFNKTRFGLIPKRFANKKLGIEWMKAEAKASGFKADEKIPHGYHIYDLGTELTLEGTCIIPVAGGIRRWHICQITKKNKKAFLETCIHCAINEK